MKQRLHTSWKNVPVRIRRPIVLIFGFFFILLAGSVGWLPGPGGIPLFLLGIAILSSEFHWAKRLKDTILSAVHTTAAHIRSHPYLTTLFILIGLCVSTIIAYMLFYPR